MKRPNILILYTDQQRWDAVGANGNPDIITPHLDELAATGVTCTHHFVQNPVCMPSRLAFLTGQYPSAHRITHMGVPVPTETVTLPRLLRNYGYRSANIGKLHFLPHANRDHSTNHPDYGFDHLEISDEPGCYEDAYRTWVRCKAPDQLDHISLGLPPCANTWRATMGITETIKHPEERFPLRALPFAGRSDVTHTAFVAEQTIEYMRAHRNDTWLCIAGFYSPHSPWVAPQEFLDLYDPQSLRLPVFPPEIEAKRAASPWNEATLRSARHRYYAMVSEVDYHVGRILAELSALGLAEDTIVVFTSDHGEWLGEHLRHGKGFPGLDVVSRVPLLMRWPGRIPAGRAISGLVESIDVIPTLLELAGIPVPPHLQGRSMQPLFTGASTSIRESALMEHAGWKNLRTDRYRYVVCDNGQEMLFDLEVDPSEYHNVAADPSYSAALSEMRGRLVQHLLAAERPLPRVWPY